MRNSTTRNDTQRHATKSTNVRIRYLNTNDLKTKQLQGIAHEMHTKCTQNAQKKDLELTKPNLLNCL